MAEVRNSSGALWWGESSSDWSPPMAYWERLRFPVKKRSFTCDLN